MPVKKAEGEILPNIGAWLPGHRRARATHEDSALYQRYTGVFHPSHPAPIAIPTSA